MRSINWRRLALALVIVALLPAATELPAVATVGIVATLLWILVAVETRAYGEGRSQVRHGESFPAAR